MERYEHSYLPAKGSIVPLLFFKGSLALNNPQRLICHWNKETKPNLNELYTLALLLLNWLFQLRKTSQIFRYFLITSNLNQLSTFVIRHNYLKLMNLLGKPWPHPNFSTTNNKNNNSIISLFMIIVLEPNSFVGLNFWIIISGAFKFFLFKKKKKKKK